jgi:DNA-binding transcriptional LysR family regulator
MRIGARISCKNPGGRLAGVTDPEWSDFKVILALHRGGSVAGAARVLGVDHSTISRRLSALEEILGACLIVRGGREFTWTAQGRIALSAAEAVESTIAGATRSIRSAKLEVGGSVRVTCPSGFVTTLTRMLPPWLEKHPLLTVELSAVNRAVDLARGEADIAIRMFKPEEPGLVCRRVLELGWGLFASSAYVAEQGMPTTVSDLSKHRLVLYVEALHGVAGPRWMEEHRGTASTIMRVDNTEVAGQALSSGGGIGVLPCFAASLRPELVRVFPEPVATSTGWLVFHETVRDTARVRTAVDLLVDFFTTHADLFAGRATSPSERDQP